MAHRRLRIAGAVLLVACAAGCASEAPESLAFADDAPVVDAPTDGAISPSEQVLVSFHANWLCELERRTFPSLDETESLLDSSLRAADIERATYDRFVTNSLPQQHIRDAVLFEHLELCLPT